MIIIIKREIGEGEKIGHFQDGVMNYNCQNPSVSDCFHLKIRDIVISTPLGLQNLNKKGTKKRILVLAVK